MYHPLLLQTEVIREMPALLDDVRELPAEHALRLYRSEAFAEDLGADESVTLPAAASRRARLARATAPLYASLLSGFSGLRR